MREPRITIDGVENEDKNSLFGKGESLIGGKEMKRWISMMLMVVAIGMNAVCLYADDTDLFVVKVPPDVLITLDLSGSMDWTPAGSTLYIGSDDGDDSNDNLASCTTDGPFYSKSGPGHTKPCYNLPQDFGPV